MPYNNVYFALRYEENLEKKKDKYIRKIQVKNNCINKIILVNS